MTKLVAIGEKGRWIGEDHPKAKLSNEDIDKVFEYREKGWSYMMIAKKFKVSRESIKSICQGRTRCQWPVRFKKVKE